MEEAKQEVAVEETQFDMVVMAMLGLFSFGQCTPRSGSAYLLHVQSLKSDNMSLQAAASCLPMCVSVCGVGGDFSTDLSGS